jgi:hypothetical protein
MALKLTAIIAVFHRGACISLKKQMSTYMHIHTCSQNDHHDKPYTKTQNQLDSRAKCFWRFWAGSAGLHVALYMYICFYSCLNYVRICSAHNLY